MAKVNNMIFEDIGRIVLDADSGEVIKAPTREELKRKIKSLRKVKLELPKELVPMRQEILKAIVGITDATHSSS